ncbi:Uncharacterised protein [Neisseria canis]|uniref:Uncharacterized protein n=1 Tax=Neisseria canis TaxID=493 RepID=A0A3S4SLC6_9NEIS|nr:hypothetical protein [Neisseria canis]VEF00435.1 Uncharacterised protein [Neisseria canis]
MVSCGNTIGILIFQPSASAMVSQGSINTFELLTDATYPVDIIEMVAQASHRPHKRP